MSRPKVPFNKPSSYWNRSQEAQRRIYFPADRRGGFAVMLFIAALGLIVMAFGISYLIGSAQIQRGDLILIVAGGLASALGFSRAWRMR